MSIKNEFEKGLGELVGKVEQGDVNAKKVVLATETYGDTTVMTEKEEMQIHDVIQLVTKNTELLVELKKLPLDERLHRLPEILADVDKKSYLSMSKRRKKRFLTRLRMFETSTGKLASVKHLGKEGFKLIPIFHVFVEKTGAGFNRPMVRWVGLTI